MQNVTQTHYLKYDSSKTPLSDPIKLISAASLASV